MLQLFNNLKGFATSNRRSTESLVFYLHYRVTFLALFFSCILVSAQHLLGRRIDCSSKPNGELSVELLNSYCWASSTYSISSAYMKEVGLEIPHPGIESSEKKSEHENRNFYQYVHIVIFIQAIMFYVPHILWKSIEKNALSRTFEVVQTFNKASTSGDDDKSIDEKLEALAVHIENRWGSYKPLVLKYLSCELLSTFNVVVQFFLLDIYFHGKFIGMGLLIETYYGSELPSDPLRLFPLVTICTFHRYGPSGAVDVFDVLCVLPFNSLTAKIYIFMWIWFVILLLLSILSIIHLLSCIILSIYRKVMSKSIIRQVNSSSDACMQLISLGDFGDWFMMTSVKKNMDEFDFAHLAEKMLPKLNSLETETREP